MARRVPDAEGLSSAVAARTKKTDSTRALATYASPGRDDADRTGAKAEESSIIAGIPRSVARSGTEADPIAQR